MPEQIGPSDIKSTIHYLGPIVYTPTTKDSDGVQQGNLEEWEPTALPPELSSWQTDLTGVGALTGGAIRSQSVVGVSGLEPPASTSRT